MKPLNLTFNVVCVFQLFILVSTLTRVIYTYKERKNSRNESGLGPSRIQIIRTSTHLTHGANVATYNQSFLIQLF